MITRPDTDDAQMLHEATNDYPNVQLAGKRVLDLGGHIGGFTKRAVDAGAEWVVTVEPWSPSFELLRANVGHYPNVTLLQKAVTTQPSLELTIGNPGAFGGVSGFSRRKGSQTEIVAGVSFAELLAVYKPNVVKMDIEGAEYDVLPTDLTGVEQFCGEFHTTSKFNRSKELLAWLAESFEVTINSRSLKRIVFLATRLEFD